MYIKCNQSKKKSFENAYNIQFIKFNNKNETCEIHCSNEPKKIFFTFKCMKTNFQYLKR